MSNPLSPAMLLFARQNGYNPVETEDDTSLYQHADQTYLCFFRATSAVFEPFRRLPNEKFTTACNRWIGSSRIVCNGPFFNLPNGRMSYLWNMTLGGIRETDEVTYDGHIYSSGSKIAGTPNGDAVNFFVMQRELGFWTFGQGNPPVNAYNACGSVFPIITGSYKSGYRSPLLWGNGNLYDEVAEQGVSQPATGEPPIVLRDNIIQRNAGVYSSLGAGEGFMALGLNRSANLLVILARDDELSNRNAQGENEHEFKSAQEHFLSFGCSWAVGFDASSSVTMRTKKQYYCEPKDYKDENIEIGFMIR